MNIAIITLGILCVVATVIAIVFASRVTAWRTRATLANERAERAETALSTLTHDRQHSEVVAGMREVVEPIRGRIEALGTNMATFIQERKDSEKATKDRIGEILATARDLERQTRDLSLNISGNNRVQGRWGEVLLANILASTGLQKGRDYEIQYSVSASADTHQNANALRPDAVIHLPEGRNIVIDAKTSLKSYKEYLNDNNDTDRATHLREHIASIKRHIDNLSSKKYEAGIDGSAEFVLMFMPNDEALSLALTADTTLYEYAYARRIVIASPSLLLVILQIVEMLWRNDKRNRQQEEIVRVGTLILEDLQMILKDIAAVGSAIDKAQTAWQTLNNHTNGDGPRSIKSRINNLGELGLNSRKKA